MIWSWSRQSFQKPITHTPGSRAEEALWAEGCAHHPPWHGVVWIGTCYTKISSSIVQNSACRWQGDGWWFCGTTKSSREVTLVWWFWLHALGCLCMSPSASLHQLNNLSCFKSSVYICKICLMELFQYWMSKCSWNASTLPDMSKIFNRYLWFFVWIYWLVGVFISYTRALHEGLGGRQWRYYYHLHFTYEETKVHTSKCVAWFAHSETRTFPQGFQIHCHTLPWAWRSTWTPTLYIMILLWKSYTGLEWN